jgi:hypothetical protein
VDTQGFSLGATGDSTAVVVTQDHQGGLAKLGLKDLLADGSIISKIPTLMPSPQLAPSFED